MNTVSKTQLQVQGQNHKQNKDSGIHPPVSLLTSMESVLPPTLHMHIIQEAHLTFRFGGSSYLCFSITPAEQFQKKYRNAVSISQ